MPLSFCEKRLAILRRVHPRVTWPCVPMLCGKPFLRGKIIAVHIYRARCAFCRASVGMTVAPHAVRLLAGILPAPLIVLRAG